MQGNQFRKLKVEDALFYLDQVKFKFGNQPQVYNDFLDIMREYKSLSVDTDGVIQRVFNLFRGHPELIVGFNTYLPLGYRIELQPNEQVQVSMPGANLGGGATSAPTSLIIHPGGPPTTTIHSTHSSQSNHSSHSTSHHSSPGNAVNKGVHTATKPLTEAEVYAQVAKLFQKQDDFLLQELGQFLPGGAAASALVGLSSNHTPPVANSQPHTNSQSQHVYNQNCPAHTQSSGESPGVRSPSSTPQASQPLEFNHAINYVNKVKNRFRGQPDIYKQFLEILHTYHKEQWNLIDGVHTVTKSLMEAEVYAQVAKLFQNQNDLLQEFRQLLQDANGAAASALVGLMAPPQWAYQVENFVNEPDEELVCSICRAIFCDPVMCPCDHVFCRACITKWLLSSRNCHICQKRASLASIKQTVPIIKNLIMKLMLKCHNKNLGCKAQFSVENSVSHMKECEYELVQCKNKPCKDQLFRKDLTEHETRDCPHRYIKCKKCRLKIPTTVLPEKHDCILQARLREKSELIKNMRIRHLRNEECSASSSYLSSDSDERDDSDFMDNETGVEYSQNESPQATAEYRNVESQTLDDLPSNVQQQHSDNASGDNSSLENENTAAEASNSVCGETGEGSCPRRPMKRRPTTEKPAKRRYPQVFVSSKEEKDDESEQHSSPQSSKQCWNMSSPETGTRGAENDQGDNSGMTPGPSSSATGFNGAESEETSRTN